MLGRKGEADGPGEWRVDLAFAWLDGEAFTVLGHEAIRQRGEGLELPSDWSVNFSRPSLASAGRVNAQLFLQLVDDLGMLLFGQGNLLVENDEGQDRQDQWNNEGKALESVDAGRGHVSCGCCSRHAAGNGDEADQAVRKGPGQFVDHWPHGQGDGFISFAILKLPVFNRVSQGQDRY